MRRRLLLPQHRPLWWIVGGSWILSLLSIPWSGWRPATLGLYIGQGFAALLVVALGRFIVRRVGEIARERRNEVMAPPWPRTASALWRQADGWHGVRRAVEATLVIAFTLSAFTGWKLRIGTLVPFWADAPLYELSVVLHGGRTLTDWLAPLLAWPAVVRVLDWLYFPAWSIALALVQAWIAWAPDSPRRRQALLVIVLCWIVLGVGLATALASGGPAYYGRLVPGVDPYAAHLAALRAIHAQAPLISQLAQDMLWGAYTQGVTVQGGGIAAMPSLHVATAHLLVLLAGDHGWRWRAPALALALATFVGSVVLGPHYAVDGYVSVGLVHGLWWVAGRATAASAAPRPAALVARPGHLGA